jgi:tRNA threonylcarbamoyladenosine biosynthesis protein TsaB
VSGGAAGPAVLGIDTATSSTAVAIALGSAPAVELRDDPPAGAHPGHATRLLGLAQQLLDGAGADWGRIERLAVGLGPGTFTGLRVGIATARGLAQSRSLPLVGVSSLAALAAPALAAAPPRAPGVLAVIDARRGEVFAAAYAQLGDGSPSELSAPRALAPEAIASALPEDAGAAAGAGTWLAVGDGAVRYRAELERAGVHVPADADPLHRVTAGAICSLGRSSAAAGDVNGVLPDYRRLPDAELALQHGRGGVR